MKTRKGQAAGGAAVLVAIIALAVILYVIFLPSDIRQELLEADDLSGDDDNKTSKNNAEYRLILDEAPGRLDSLDLKDCMGNECKHEISSFTLFRTTDSSIIHEENPFIVKNNIMTKQFHTVNFEVQDSKNTENLMMTFNARKHEGVLKVRLNGNVIFEQDLDTFNPNPISIPSSIISKYNVLEFEVSKVGPAFWKTNVYSIESLRIIGDITDTSRQTSNNVFFVPDSEYFNLESAKLRFSPDCLQREAGMLQITLNNNELFYGVPDCQTLNQKVLNPTYIEQGENVLMFRTESGSYMMDLIEVTTSIRDVKYPIYYFNLEDDELRYIREGDANLNISFEFADDFEFVEDYQVGEEYELIFTINGRKIYMSTYDEHHTREISFSEIREEDNWIKVQPKSGYVDVTKMKLELIPVD